MFVTDIEEMHSKPGRYRVVYHRKSEGSSDLGPKQIWKEDLSELEAKQEEVACYRTLNEL